MICKSCGAFLSDDLTECPVCHTVVEKSNTADENIDADMTAEKAEFAETAENTDIVEDANTIESPALENKTNELTATREDGIYLDQMTDNTDSGKKVSKSAIAAIILAIFLAISMLFTIFLLIGRNKDSAFNSAYNKITGFFGDIFSDNKVKENKPDDVVAVVGDHVLTNAQLSIYYYDSVYYLYSVYGSHAFDPTTSLFDQPYSDDTSWGDMIASYAIDTWHSTMAILDAAKAENYEMSQEYKTAIEEIPNNIKTIADEKKMTSDEYISSLYGPFVTMDIFLPYITEYYYCDSYYTEKFDELYRNYLDDDIDSLENYNVSVRHILISPEVKDDQESKNAALEKAQEILGKWESGGATEELFIEYVTEYSDDTASVPNGGLYEDFGKGAMVEPFENWCLDSSRQPGDCEIVETVHGYHIIYFLTRTNPNAYEKASNEMTAWHDEQLNKAPISKQLDKMTIKTVTTGF